MRKTTEYPIINILMVGGLNLIGVPLAFSELHWLGLIFIGSSFAYAHIVSNIYNKDYYGDEKIMLLKLYRCPDWLVCKESCPFKWIHKWSDGCFGHKNNKIMCPKCIQVKH